MKKSRTYHPCTGLILQMFRRGRREKAEGNRYRRSGETKRKTGCDSRAVDAGSPRAAREDAGSLERVAASVGLAYRARASDPVAVSTMFGAERNLGFTL